MKRTFMLITVLIFILAGCTKEEMGKDAIIRWTGEYKVDGCGFFIDLNGKTYKPDNENKISEEFKKNSAAVVIDYRLPNKDIEYNCGDLPEKQKANAIEIISIKKK